MDRLWVRTIVHAADADGREREARAATLEAGWADGLRIMVTSLLIDLFSERAESCLQLRQESCGGGAT